MASELLLTILLTMAMDFLFFILFFNGFLFLQDLGFKIQTLIKRNRSIFFITLTILSVLFCHSQSMASFSSQLLLTMAMDFLFFILFFNGFLFLQDLGFKIQTLMAAAPKVSSAAAAAATGDLTAAAPKQDRVTKQHRTELDAMPSTRKAVKRSTPTASVTTQPKQDHVAKQHQIDIDHQKFLENAFRRLEILQKELDAMTFTQKAVKISAPTVFVTKQPKQDHVVKQHQTDNDHQMFLEDAFRRLNALQKELDAMPSYQKTMKSSVPTASVTKQPKQYHVAKLKSDEKEDLKLLATARRVIKTSKTETKPKKDCVRSAPTASAPKKPNQDHVAKLRSAGRKDLRPLVTARRVITTSKTETKPKKDCVRSAPTASAPKQTNQDHVAKLRSAGRKDLMPLATARRVITTSKTETKPKKDCVRSAPTASVPKQSKQDHVAKLRSDEREDLKPTATARRVMTTLKTETEPLVSRNTLKLPISRKTLKSSWKF